MDCPNCGKRAPTFSAFCGSCGASLGRKGISWRPPDGSIPEAVQARPRAGRRVVRGILLLGVFGVLILTPAGRRIGSLLLSSVSSAFEGGPGPETEGGMVEPGLVTEGSDPATAPVSLATATNDYEELVLGYLDSTYEVNLQDQGFGPAFQSHKGSLGTSSNGFLTLSLPPHADLAILGVCDNECDDLDLVLQDSDGEVVDSDVTTDDIPLLYVQTGEGGGYSLEIRMITCTIEPCYWAVGVFQRS